MYPDYMEMGSATVPVAAFGVPLNAPSAKPESFLLD